MYWYFLAAFICKNNIRMKKIDFFFFFDKWIILDLAMVSDMITCSWWFILDWKHIMNTVVSVEHIHDWLGFFVRVGSVLFLPDTSVRLDENTEACFSRAQGTQDWRDASF